MENYTGSRLETSRLFNPSVAQMLNAVCAWCDVAAYQRHLLARVAVCGAANADRMKSGRAVAGIDGHGPHRVLCVVSAPGSAGGGSTVKFVLNDEHGFLEIIFESLPEQGGLRSKHGQGRTRFIIIAIIALITTLITTITATTTTTISKLWIVRLIKSISTATKSGHSYSESRTIIQTVEAPASSIIEENPATFRTVTVTGTPAVSTIAAVADNTNNNNNNNNNDTPSATDSPTPHSDDNGGGGGSGLKQGTIVGIAVGGSAAGVFVGLIAFMVWRRNRYKGDDDGDSGRRQSEEVQGVVDYFGTANGATSIKRDNTSASEDSRMGAFGQNKNLYRNSIGSLEDTSSDWGQVLRVVNPDVPEKQH
ncbi:hypothetical protein MY8738_009163 [Beauveria namnaoensis]